MTTTNTTSIRATLNDADLLVLIEAHKVTSKTQAIVDAIRAQGYKASLPRVNRLMGRFYKLNPAKVIVVLHDAHVQAFDAAVTEHNNVVYSAAFGHQVAA